MPIISRIGRAGDELNFHVAFYSESFPASAAENTIGMIADPETVSQWVMQAEEPTHSDGLVWIQLSTASPTPFSASKKQTVMVYPIRAQISLGGSWTALTAKCFQNGSWNAWMILLYQYGETVFADSWSTSGSLGTVSETSSVGGFSLTQSASSASYIRGNVYHSERIDVSGGTTLHARVKLSAVYGSSGVWFYTDSELLAPSSTLSPAMVDGAMTRINEASTSEWKELTLDISSLSGNKYVGFYLSVGQNLSHTLSVQKVWIS